MGLFGKGTLKIREEYGVIDAYKYQKKSCKRLEISDNVTEIRDHAFWSCASLEEVVLPDSIKIIGYDAFDGCPKLKFNEYENGLYLGSRTNPYIALAGVKNKRVSSFKVHEDTKAIAAGAFRNCGSLVTVQIPEDIQGIGTEAFYDCNSLDCTIEIPSWADVRANAFNSSRLKIIFSGSSSDWAWCTRGVYPEFESCFATRSSVSYMDPSDFQKMRADRKAAAKKAQEDAERSAAQAAAAAQAVEAERQGEARAVEKREQTIRNLGDNLELFANARYFGDEDNPYEKLVAVSDMKVTTCLIHEDTKYIGEGAFAGCSILKKVALPVGLTGIAKNAFRGCSRLNFTEFGGVKYLGDGKNAYMAAIEVTSKAVKSIKFHQDTKIIAEGALDGCGKLETVSLPGGLRSIGKGVFDGCKLLEYELYGTAQYLGNEKNPYIALVKTCDKAIRQCDIHPDVTVVADGAFAGCTIERLTVPLAVVETFPRAMVENLNWLSLIGGGSVGALGRSKGNTGKVPSRVFRNLDKLETLKVGGGITEIGDGAFSGCENLQFADIGDSVKTIGFNAFGFCTNLSFASVSKSCEYQETSFPEGCTVKVRK